MGFGSALAAGASILSDAANMYTTIGNYQIQKNVARWNQENQLEAWARDDTARQRMVKDLEAAGLSKWLAAGASPMTSSPISLTAPQMGEINLDAMQHIFDNKLAEQQTDAQTALQDKQASLADASTAVQEAELKIKQEELKEKAADASIAQHNAEVWSNRPGIASNDPSYMKAIGEGANVLNGNSAIAGRIGQAAQKGLRIAADASPAVAAVYGAYQGGKKVVGKVKDFFLEEIK